MNSFIKLGDSLIKSNLYDRSIILVNHLTKRQRLEMF